MFCQGEYFSDINDFVVKVIQIMVWFVVVMYYFGGDGGKIMLDMLECVFVIICWYVDEIK